MVVFRFHDHWHARRPDGIATGMARELGWEKQADPDEPATVRFAGRAAGAVHARHPDAGSASGPCA